jgi:hypothetical protein
VERGEGEDGSKGGSRGDYAPETPRSARCVRTGWRAVNRAIRSCMVRQRTNMGGLVGHPGVSPEALEWHAPAARQRSPPDYSSVTPSALSGRIRKIRKFIISDENHLDNHGTFSSLDAALKRLRRLAKTPWNEGPNRAPCIGWWGCGRDYAILEFEASQSSWEQRSTIPAVAISRGGVTWYGPFRASRPFARRPRTAKRARRRGVVELRRLEPRSSACHATRWMPCGPRSPDDQECW